MLVKEFLSDDFVKYIMTNAIRLKSDAGILDFETITALNEISLFTKANIMVLDEKSYIDDILWHLILNVTLSRYYTKGFDCPIDNILLVSKILDKDNNLMHRDNNNLVSISELIKELGASTVRLYYALNKNDETQSFDKEGLIEMSNLLDKIIKVYYYPIDDTCRDLDNAYFAFVKETSRYAKNYDFQAYFDSIIEFVKKVHDVRHISRAQAKGLLIILSVLTPALAEQIKTDVLNLKEPLYYYSWPEL
jgi:leucyl-tRNA synthetase